MVKSEMKESLAEKTRIYIDAHPSVKDCVAKGLINYSSLSTSMSFMIILAREE